jgi:hypothetical protein
VTAQFAQLDGHNLNIEGKPTSMVIGGVQRDGGAGAIMNAQRIKMSTTPPGSANTGSRTATGDESRQLTLNLRRIATASPTKPRVHAPAAVRINRSNRQEGADAFGMQFRAQA